MVSAIGSALSGLNASETRLDVSANNIANQSSKGSIVNGKKTDTPYTPQRVDQVSLSSGGVLAQVSNANPQNTNAPGSQGNGAAQQQPSADQADQLVQQNIAAYDFKANLKTIQTQDNIIKSLLDIVS